MACKHINRLHSKNISPSRETLIDSGQFDSRSSASRKVQVMPFSAAAVANELLARASADGRSLTQINIQKLAYFAHGWHLAWSGSPLVTEPILAWQYGPVLRSLYSQFRGFGSSAITSPAIEYRSDGLKVVTTIPSMAEKPEDEYGRSVVGAIWKQYGALPPFKLVELTHASGSPWEKARAMGRDVIETEDIKTYFRLLGQTTA